MLRFYNPGIQPKRQVIQLESITANQGLRKVIHWHLDLNVYFVKYITVGLIITTRNFGQCVVNLYEVQKTQCVVIVGWSKILKIRVFLQTKHRVFLKSRNSVFFVAPQIRRAGFVGEVFLANPASFCMERDLWVKFFSQIPLHFAWSRICG